MVNAVKVKLVNRVYVQLVAVVIMIVHQTYHVTIMFVKIHAMKIFAVQMHCVKLKVMSQNVNVQPVSMVIQHQNKDVYEFHQVVYRRAVARMVICALEMFVKYHVLIQFHVQSVNDAITMFAQKFATQIIIAYLVKSVMSVVHVKRAV